MSTYISLTAQMVNNLPAMQETWALSLGQEDPLEKGMATHSSILPGEFHGQRSLAGYSPWGWKASGMTGWLILSLFTHYVPDTLLRASYILNHLIITTTICDKYYYYLHFTNKDIKEKEVQSFAQGHRACHGGAAVWTQTSRLQGLRCYTFPPLQKTPVSSVNKQRLVCGSPGTAVGNDKNRRKLAFYLEKTFLSRLIPSGFLDLSKF